MPENIELNLIRSIGKSDHRFGNFLLPIRYKNQKGNPNFLARSHISRKAHPPPAFMLGVAQLVTKPTLIDAT